MSVCQYVSCPELANHDSDGLEVQKEEKMSYSADRTGEIHVSSVMASMIGHDMIFTVPAHPAYNGSFPNLMYGNVMLSDLCGLS